MSNLNIFLGIYSSVLEKELLQSAMLLNRRISFYIFVIIRLIVIIVNILRTKNIKMTEKAS